MKKQFRIFAIMIILTIAICIPLYSESYSFWREAVSYLGGSVSFDEGNSNTVGMITFTSCFWIIGMYCSILGDYYKDHDNYLYNELKGNLIKIMGVGALFVGLPYDILNFIHTIGAIMFVLGYAVLNIIMQELRFWNKNKKHPILMGTISMPIETNYLTLDRIIDLLIGIIIFVLVIFYVFTSEYKYLFQKLILIVSVISIFRLDEDDF